MSWDWVILSKTQYSVYVSCWVAFCLLSVVTLAFEVERLRREWPLYLQFLVVRWKLVVFVPAFLFVTFAGRFTDDETWDVISGGGMSLLTYLTAPYAIGSFYQATCGLRRRRYLFVAVVLCLFSSSWFYDAYLLIRDGMYTSRWFGNLLVSPVIYIAAGLLWNLETNDDGAVAFSFMRKDWPAPPRDTRIAGIVWALVPFIFVAAVSLVAFVGWRL